MARLSSPLLCLVRWQTNELTNTYIKSFVGRSSRDPKGRSDWAIFKEQVQQRRDAECCSCVNIAEKWELSELRKHVRAINAATVKPEDASLAQVFFSTTHKAKGRGWHTVYLAKDFMSTSGISLTEAAEQTVRRSA